MSATVSCRCANRFPESTVLVIASRSAVASSGRRLGDSGSTAASLVAAVGCAGLGVGRGTSVVVSEGAACAVIGAGTVDARPCAVTGAAGVLLSANARAGAAGTRACAVTTSGSADTLAISLFTRLRNSVLNCAPGWESLLAMYSIFGPISFFDPMPPKVIDGSGLYTSIILPTRPVTAGFQLSI